MVIRVPEAFTQTGGTNSVGNYLYLGNNAGSSGAFNLGGGQLSAVYDYVGSSGTGSFTQSGGTNNLYYLYVGANSASSGTYNLLGSGQLSASTNTSVTLPELLRHSSRAAARTLPRC